ncbi:DNA polymerase [Phascolarctid gammaherpesvirus 1]|uniref:DNA polymerase n=2 Tax=Gammaherpesvirinae TaxID=10374 RepID=A0A3S8D7K9_9GAMA|nr:DNA polymerase [Phascolarctid gammaherpesvirus 1]AZB49187.1 DNA polymerase [Phascolarctid gammaherpesvirus 1]
MSFMNPYLANRSRPGKLCSRTSPTPPVPNTLPNQSITRLVPNCFRTSGAAGVTVFPSDHGPLCFMEDKFTPIFNSGGRSLWWSPSKETPTNSLTQVVFHVYDVVETCYTGNRCDEVPFRLQSDILPSGIVLKLLGRTKDNRTICVNVFGQRIYFYVKPQPGRHCNNLDFILRSLAQNRGGAGGFSYSIYPTKKRLLRTFDTTDHDVYKISLTSNENIHSVVSKLQEHGFEVFEANVDAARRFIIDNKFTTFGWYRCTKPDIRYNYRDSWTDLEVDCHVSDLEVLDEAGACPPYTIMSFDIECLGTRGFPNARTDEDMIIQISCIFWSMGTDDPYEKILLSLGTCSSTTDFKVMEFPSEYDLLVCFLTLLRDRHVEIVTGYNIGNFDFPYILERASLVYNLKPEDYTKVKSGKQFEVQKPKEDCPSIMRAFTKTKISGIVAIDMYLVCKDKLSLSDYKLNTVAQVITGSKKEDLSYKDIPVLFRQDRDGRQRIGSYCIQDSVLVLDLLKHFMYHLEIIEIAKIAHITPRRVLNEGQQCRVFSCLLAGAEEEGYILPMNTNTEQSGYQGATVISPISGFYYNPVMVVDFASLYPSIIQRHNLCYSTLVPADQLYKHPHLKPDDYETFNISSGPVHFVKKHVRESLLARLLTAWLDMRRSIKKELKACTDPKLAAILDKRQNAIKVTCNSVYGFTGVASGILPCLKIAETVTLQGRTMLERSKAFMESLSTSDLESIVGHTVPSEKDSSLRVIYGDTDSLFVECRGYQLDVVLDICDAIALHTTKTLFKDPVKLEAEKTFRCLLMITKKRYLGVLPDGKILMKGVDLVRKTACTFVQNTSRCVLDLVLKDPEVMSAAHELSRRPASESYTKGLPNGFFKVIKVLLDARHRLHKNSIPISELTFSTELSRDYSSYKTKNLPHLVVYNKIISRNEEPPQIKDRIQYAFIKPPQGTKSTKVSDMAEDPKFIIQNHTPLATEYYFEKVLHSVSNILQCLFENSASQTFSILCNYTELP